MSEAKESQKKLRFFAVSVSVANWTQSEPVPTQF